MWAKMIFPEPVFNPKASPALLAVDSASAHSSWVLACFRPLPVRVTLGSRLIQQRQDQRRHTNHSILGAAYFNLLKKKRKVCSCVCFRWSHQINFKGKTQISTAWVLWHLLKVFGEDDKTRNFPHARALSFGANIVCEKSINMYLATEFSEGGLITPCSRRVTGLRKRSCHFDFHMSH